MAAYDRIEVSRRDLEFEINELRHSTIAYLYEQRQQIELQPEYQRDSGIWTLEKKQLLIDSLLNGFDIPKIYFHQHTTPQRTSKGRHNYAIIDGKQRMEAIWNFIQDEFPLAEDFEYFEDRKVAAGGMTYSALSDSYPILVGKFNATPLNVMAIRTNDLSTIEEMFSRLNEAVPLNAPEKRNAIGGPLPAAVRELARENPFFTEALPIYNARYRHYDLAAKFLLWAHAGEVADVKKYHLDAFFREMKEDNEGQNKVDAAKRRASEILERMSSVFTEHDPLLKSVGMVSLFFLLLLLHPATEVRREVLEQFDETRRRNRAVAEEDLSEAQWALIEFDNLAQSPNDEWAVSYRLGVLLRFLKESEK